MIASKEELRKLLSITSMTQDELIEQLIPIIEDDIRQYCNNGFQDKRVYIASSAISFTHNAGTADTINLDADASGEGFIDSQFKSGQTVQVQGAYNNDNFFEVETVSSTVMTLYAPADRPYFPVLVTEDEDAFVWITKVEYPPALKLVESQMLKYKLASHDYSVASETVSRYSVSFNQMTDGGYPKAIMSALNRWRRPVIV